MRAIEYLKQREKQLLRQVEILTRDISQQEDDIVKTTMTLREVQGLLEDVRETIKKLEG